MWERGTRRQPESSWSPPGRRLKEAPQLEHRPTVKALSLDRKRRTPRVWPAGLLASHRRHLRAAAAASMERLAKTLSRWRLYSSEPWRSAWTSTPSGAFSAAAWMVAASSALPASPASTPLALTALLPAPVIPTPAFVTLPPSTVSTAATPTTANREAGWGNFR